MQTQKICPYPGLRPFNEEESIFFKGREDHIGKIINQLQEKRFLMVTGASGDGKSSLIYAGLIPRARAGFFKARYNNWLIADFRPERTPVKNLAIVLNEHLGYNDLGHVEKELNYGFSSLVKLYKESPCYINQDTAKFKNSNEDEKIELKNKGSNLLILVDQFEELFTNSQNFNNGRPSVEAATLINLIIETTNIAMEENLPIYIVCTMRSDYIGDCAAFKGFPEHVVYSQFFVPRLKRQEIHRAILEPAKLSGNKINNRLIEKIINELSDGQDQLPILQHALNRIWRAHIEDNAPEMDLIHFAKVGGIDGELLPDEHKMEFIKWLNEQPDYKVKILSNPSLLNILNAHARELFETAYDNYAKQGGAKLNKEEAKAALQKIFTCLTKINDNRAVRNRVSVKEVKQILGEGKIDNELIAGLINPFRQPGNTLVKPFIDSKTSTEKLSDNDILDITHESLIRNWSELIEWTRKDHENVLVLSDFKKQLERWESNKRSKDYLLTVGSLAYFNSWHINLNPNPYLLTKYDESNISSAEKFKHSQSLLNSANDFLSRSNSAIKQKRRTAVMVASTIILVLIGFTAWAFMERNKAVAQQEIALEKTVEATKSKEEALGAKSLAEQSKEEAVKNEAMALQALQEAEKSKALAEKATIEARQNYIAAQKNAVIAKSEADKATKALAESERAKNEALQAKSLAEKAENKAVVSEKKTKELSVKALSQQLAYKATEKFDDPQLPALLAVHAYDYHNQANKNALDPVVYDALMHAQKGLSGDASFCFSSMSGKEQKLLVTLDENTIMTIGNDGYVYTWDITGKKMISKDNSELSKHGPMNYSLYDKDAHCVFVGFDNGVTGIYEITPDKKLKNVLEFDELRGLLRGGSYNKSDGKVVLLTKMGDIVAFNRNKPKEIKRNSTNKRITSFNKFNGNELYVGTSTGEVLSISADGDAATLFENIGSWVTAIKTDNKKLFVGTSNGNLIEYNQKGSKWQEDNKFSIAKGFINKIDFNAKLKKCVVVSSDKIISIIDYDNANSKPSFIYTPDLYIRSMAISNDGKIYCSSSDFKIREYNTDMSQITGELCKTIKRDMDKAEWEKYVGAEVEYKNLKCLK